MAATPLEKKAIGLEELNAEEYFKSCQKSDKKKSIRITLLSESDGRRRSRSTISRYNMKQFFTLYSKPGMVKKSASLHTFKISKYYIEVLRN